MSGLTTVGAGELAALDVFAGIPAGDLAALAANLEPLHAAPGEVLMRQGEHALSFVIIASGRVEISHVGPDGVVERSGALGGADRRRNRSVATCAQNRDRDRQR